MGRQENVAIIRSINGSKRRYRWLLRVSENPSWNIGKSEQTAISRQLAAAKRANEAVYLVVGFLPEPKRIVVVPAAGALKAGRVRSDKGGIAWED